MRHFCCHGVWRSELPARTHEPNSFQPHICTFNLHRFRCATNTLTRTAKSSRYIPSGSGRTGRGWAAHHYSEWGRAWNDVKCVINRDVPLGQVRTHARTRVRACTTMIQYPMATSCASVMFQFARWPRDDDVLLYGRPFIRHSTRNARLSAR